MPGAGTRPNACCCSTSAGRSCGRRASSLAGKNWSSHVREPRHGLRTSRSYRRDPCRIFRRNRHVSSAAPLVARAIPATAEPSRGGSCRSAVTATLSMVTPAETVRTTTLGEIRGLDEGPPRLDQLRSPIARVRRSARRRASANGHGARWSLGIQHQLQDSTPATSSVCSRTICAAAPYPRGAHLRRPVVRQGGTCDQEETHEFSLYLESIIQSYVAAMYRG